MRRILTASVFSLGLLLPLSSPAAEPPRTSPAAPIAPRVAFETLKKLAGEWHGTIDAPDGPETTVLYRVTAAGSAVVETLSPGTDHEMITVYHMDRDRLLLTHYCAAGNQPRMLFDPARSTPAALVFEFEGGTNLDPGKDVHMHAAKILLPGPDRIESEWFSWQDGKPAGSHRFYLTRK